MIENVQVVQAFTCVCNCCQKRWTAYGKLPTGCANPACRTREWDGQKHPSRTSEIKLPAPRGRGRPKAVALLDVDEEF
jgi:hypothetical protein